MTLHVMPKAIADLIKSSNKVQPAKGSDDNAQVFASMLDNAATKPEATVKPAVEKFTSPRDKVAESDRPVAADKVEAVKSDSKVKAAKADAKDDSAAPADATDAADAADKPAKATKTDDKAAATDAATTDAAATATVDAAAATVATPTADAAAVATLLTTAAPVATTATPAAATTPVVTAPATDDIAIAAAAAVGTTVNAPVAGVVTTPIAGSTAATDTPDTAGLTITDPALANTTVDADGTAGANTPAAATTPTSTNTVDADAVINNNTANTQNAVATTAADALLEGLVATPAAANSTAIAGGSTDTKTVTGLNDAGAKAALDAMAATTHRASNEALQNTTAMKAAVAAPNAEPYKQVVNIVQPLKQLGDGDYQMTLRLHPEHLGRVEIAVSLNAGQINMQMNADNAQSRQLLRDSMNDLRSSLQNAGLTAGSLDVGTGDAGSQRDASNFQGGNRSNSANWADESNDEFFSRLATVAQVPQTASTDGPLDVRL